MRPLSLLAACLALAVTLPVRAEPLSTLSVPVIMPLDGLRAVIESALPRMLIGGSREETCIPAETMCTDIPEFRGLKIYRRRACIDITPRIGCTITENVTRVGEVSIDGKDGVVRISQLLHGQATVRGSGDIARNIRETAEGRARLTLTVFPRVTADWQIEADIGHEIFWEQPPSARLFNLFDVTFQSKATEKLASAITAYTRDQMPGDLARIALRDRLAPLWNRLQVPVALPVPQGAPLDLRFRPQTVALAPFTVQDNALITRLALTGHFRLSDQTAPHEAPVPLPALSPAPAAAGLDLRVPVSLGLDTLSDLAGRALPLRVGFFKPFRYRIDIHAVRFEPAPAGALRARLQATAHLPALPPAGLSGVLSGQPHWDASTRVLSLREARLLFDADSPGGHILNTIAATPTAQARLAAAVRLPLGERIDALGVSLITALDTALGANLKTAAALRLSLDNVRLDHGLQLEFRLHGPVSLILRAPD